MKWWNDLWVKKASDWTFAKLGNGQTLSSVPSELIKPNEGYVSLILKSMRVVNLRKGLSKFYGTVNSYVTLPQLNDLGRVNTIVTPHQLKLADASRLDRIISMDHRLFGPLPYRGGDLNVEIGLFSIKESELVGPFLELLESVASIAGISYLKTAMPFVEPIKRGFERLAGSNDDSILELGLHRSFTSIETGIYVVIGAKKGSVDINSLTLDLNDNKLVSSKQGGLEAYPYFVLEIVKDVNRGDYFAIPDFRERYENLNQLVLAGKYKEVADSLIEMKRFLFTSFDLLRTDAIMIFEKIEKETNEILHTSMTQSVALRPLPSLMDLNPYA